MQVKNITTLLLFICCATHLSAQTKSITKKDTVTVPADSSKVFTFDENGLQDYSNGQLPFQLSNHLDGFQVYHEKHANLGNAGSAEKNLSLPITTSDGFNRGPNSFSYFGYNDLNRRFFSCEKPYTKLFYVSGQKQEVDAFVTHAHPLGKNALIGFQFDRIRSAGFYRKQNTNNTSVDLNGWYRSPGRRYAFLADVNWTTINEEENGGIKRDSSFFFANQLDRQLVGVYLSSAKTSQRAREAWFKQYWAFGNIVDTIVNDSSGFRTKIRPSWALVHTMSVRDEVYKFSDKDTLSNYFPAQYSDTSLTNDSTYMWKVKSGLWLERFADTSRIISGKIGVRAESGEILNDTIYQHFQNVFADGSFKLDLHRNFAKAYRNSSYVSANGWNILSGTNAGDYQVNLKLFQTFSKTVSGWVDLCAGSRHPDFLYEHYSGNHYRWENAFSPVDRTSIRLNSQNYFGKDSRYYLQLSGSMNMYGHELYFDSAYQLPQQFNGTINAFDVRFKLFAGFGPIRTLIDATYNSPPASNPIHLPKYVIRQSIYAEWNLFKHALLLQTGIDGTYFSSFYCDAWNPNLAQFFVQNSEKTSDYVYMDAWVSMKIRSVRFFVKADNFNSSFSGRRYMIIPHAPQNDMDIRFGLSWVFND